MLPQEEKQAAEEAALSPDAARLARVLAATPQGLAQLCEKAALSPAAAMGALTELELFGMVRQLPGRLFVSGV